MPKRARIVPTIAGETTIISSPVPPALSSSATMASSYIPAPPPPYSAGRLTPRKPSLPASSHSSAIGSCAADLARVYSQPYFADSSATTRRSSCCSLVSVKSMVTPPLAAWRPRVARSGLARCRGRSAWFDNGEHGADFDLLAGLHGQLGDDAGRRGVDLVLHLHRLQPQQRLAPGDPIADVHGDAGDGSGHRGEQRAGDAWSAGSAKRSTRRRATAPSGEST